MAIQSIDNLITAISAGRTQRHDWNKITGAAAYTAGRWYDFSTLGGNPVANAWAGTSLSCINCNASSGFGMLPMGTVGSLIKHLLNMAAWGTAATAVPSVLMLVDMQYYYPGIDSNTTAQTSLVGTPVTRYTNGEGLRAYVAIQTNTTGANATNLSYEYVDQGGATAASPLTVAATVSAIPPHIFHSGVAANNYGPFLPLAGGDTGIQQFNWVRLSVAAGTAARPLVLVVCKPLAQITIGVASLMTEKDLLNQIPSLPIIKDDACLTWLVGCGANMAASTTLAGSLEAVWG